MSLLAGKVAIITGAGRGIGRATALLFAEHGAHVIANDLGVGPDGSPKADPVASAVVHEIVQRGGSAIASSHDVSKPAGAAELAALALAHSGTIDVLINNAGIHRDASLLKVSLADWQAVIEVQLQAALLCTQVVAPHMKNNGGGSIVNTTSLAGLVGNYGQASTATALAGVYGLTRTAAIELQRYQIRVNAVAPLAKTRLTEQLPIFHQVESMTPEHVAPVHLFLASALSDDLTGVVLGVAGGRISSYKLIESRGQFKEGEGGIWTAEEIAEHWPAISKV
jgi:NAD(P)-dependent dehydrogenase (short-subunit alcohol dehydrogenase family)